MSDILNRIADYKREEVAARKAAITLDELEAKAKAASSSSSVVSAMRWPPRLRKRAALP